MQLAVKRAMDVAASAVLIVLTGPVMLIAAVLVRRGSAGPALFTGQRWGRDGTRFACLKLRTMHVDQAEILARHGLKAVGEQGRMLLFAADPRITRVGAVLRRFGIDELPQLFNVLRGDMSLVGPRPLALPMLEPYPAMREERSVMRPGITGLWQVRHRTKNASVFDMIDDDREYTARFSLWLDLKILAWTIPRIVEPPVGDPAPETMHPM